MWFTFLRSDPWLLRGKRLIRNGAVGAERQRAAANVCRGCWPAQGRPDLGVGVRRVTADRLYVRGQAKPGAKDAPRSGRPGVLKEKGD